jgi:hypothetical protein
MSKKLSISFKNVPELLEKVEKIKAFAIENSTNRKKELNERGIRFIELNEYGVAINIEDLAKDDIVWLNNGQNKINEFIKQLEQ